MLARVNVQGEPLKKLMLPKGDIIHLQRLQNKLARVVLREENPNT